MTDNQPSPVVPPLLVRSAPAVPPLQYWSKRLLACNPFYLISAACLLYGLYRLTIDPALRNAEFGQLAAIFGSLQVYEVLLVGTAIFLARRRIWYDSTLLVTLENMLVFVPFILVTVAAFLGNKVVWIVCGTGAGLAILKFWGLKRLIRELNLPARLLLIGAALLIANLMVPFVFKAIQKVDAAPLADYSRYGWVVVLPVLFAFINLLRRPDHWGGVAAQRSWLPLGFAAIWFAVSAVHLYCLGYIYDLAWQPALLAPLLWIASWTLYNRKTDFADLLPIGWREELIVLPAVMVLLGIEEVSSWIVLSLAAINAVIYAALYMNRHNKRFTGHLLVISLATMFAAMPESWAKVFFPADPRAYCVLGASLTYIVVRSIFSRHPIWGLVGAIALAFATGNKLNDGNFAAQAGLFYFLVHSLRWSPERQADGVRTCAVVVWLLQAAFWVFGDEPTYSWVTAIAAMLLFGSYAIAWYCSRRWVSTLLPIAAGLVLLMIPVKWVVTCATAGLMAVLLAFVLFGAGTLIALMREKWNPLQKPY